LKVTNFFTVGGSSNAPAKYIRNQWQVADDIDYIHGRNHYSFGGEFIAGQMDATNLTYANGEFNFQAASATSAGQENALVDYLLGNVNTFLDSNVVVSGLRQKYIGLYVQDDFQFTKNLTVHAGLRWEPFLPEYDAGGRGNSFSMANFTAGTVTSLYTNAPPGLLFYGDPGIPKAYTDSSYNNFAPRFGLAWDPTGAGKESVRASYGIFFDQPESYTNSVFALDAPWGNTITDASIGGIDKSVCNLSRRKPLSYPHSAEQNLCLPHRSVVLFHSTQCSSPLYAAMGTEPRASGGQGLGVRRGLFRE
jgi:outer membrane receptor protein involved in Fe transport